MPAPVRHPSVRRPVTVPVPDEAEARWDRSLVVAVDGGTSAWVVAPEGELALDVYVTPTHVVVRSPLAGVKPEEVSISLLNDLLTIRGRRVDEEQVSIDRYVVQECYWGSFSRSVVLPVSVDSAGAEAVLKHGILKVTLRRIAPTPVAVRAEGEAW
jgi:HSP20 family molecular chaperone IbpA